MVSSSEVEDIGSNILWSFLLNECSVLREKLNLQRLCNSLRDVSLYLENVLQLSVVLLRPDWRLTPDVDQLDGDTQSASGLSHASLENSSDLEFSSDLPYALACLFVLHHRCSCDYLQTGDRRKGVDDLLGKAVRKILVLLVRTNDRQRKSGDPSRLKSVSLGGLAPLRGRQNSVDFCGGLHVLQPVLSKGHHAEVFVLPHVIIDLLSYADSAGVSKRLDSRSDVHRIPIDISVPVFNISEVNGDPQQNLLFGSDALIPSVHQLLDFYGTSHCFESTWKFNQKPIADSLDLATSVSRKDRTQQLSVIFK